VSSEVHGLFYNYAVSYVLARFNLPIFVHPTRRGCPHELSHYPKTFLILTQMLIRMHGTSIQAATHYPRS
jgi:hypothetical protein